MKSVNNHSLLQSNLEYLRVHRKGYSVKEMANAIGVPHRTTYYSWERGDAQPNIQMLLKLAHEFDVSVDELLRTDLRKQVKNNKIQSQKGLYEVELVPYKAVAGYSSGYSDTEWRQENIRKITIPFKPPLGEVRAFPVTGNSMEPKVSDGSYIIGVKLEDPKNEVKDGKDYVIVTRDNGIMYKIFFHMGKEAELRSLNYKEHQPIRIQGKEILQVWKYFCALDIGKLNNL